MKPVFQTVTHAGRGNCHQAAVASTFDLDLSQVPNFILYPEDQWWNVFCCFIWGLGYEFHGRAYLKDSAPSEHEDINGFYLATVPSKTFEGKTHAVVINKKGMVAHDPNPNKKWLGINVIQSGELLHWDIIGKRES